MHDLMRYLKRSHNGRLLEKTPSKIPQDVFILRLFWGYVTFVGEDCSEVEVGFIRLPFLSYWGPKLDLGRLCLALEFLEKLGAGLPEDSRGLANVSFWRLGLCLTCRPFHVLLVPLLDLGMPQPLPEALGNFRAAKCCCCCCCFPRLARFSGLPSGLEFSSRPDFRERLLPSRTRPEARRDSRTGDFGGDSLPELIFVLRRPVSMLSVSTQDRSGSDFGLLCSANYWKEEGFRFWVCISNVLAKIGTDKFNSCKESYL